MRYFIVVIIVVLFSCGRNPKRDIPTKAIVPDTLYLLFYERPFELFKDTSVYERGKNKVDSVQTFYYYIPKSLHIDFAIPFRHEIGKDSVYYKPYDYFFNSSKELKDPLWIKNKYISTDTDFMGNYDRDKRPIFIVEEDFEAGRLKLTQVHFRLRIRSGPIDDMMINY